MLFTLNRGLKSVRLGTCMSVPFARSGGSIFGMIRGTSLLYLIQNGKDMAGMINDNERAALLMGWEQLDTERYEYPWRGPDGYGYYECPNYVEDIAAAETLVPLFGTPVVMEYDPAGIPDMGDPYWSVSYSRSEAMQCAATLSAAIVDAFLAVKGG